MSKAKLNYTMIEKELLVVVHCLNKSRHYIIGNQAFIYTDHGVIKHLINKRNVNAKIIRWLFLLQQFDLTVIDKLGIENVVADFCPEWPCL